MDNDSMQLDTSMDMSLRGGNTGPIDIHEPFTAVERIQQLNEIDNDIATLLQHTSAALKAITRPPNSVSKKDNESDNEDEEEQDQQQYPDFEGPEASEYPLAKRFLSIQKEFLATLDHVDKQLKRQIYALEEAGIITLRQTTEQQQQDAETGAEEGGGMQAGAPGAGLGGPAGAGPGGVAGNRSKGPTARLEPNGMGQLGNLDVGLVNMASSTVERDMERELWNKAGEHLKEVAAERNRRGDRMQE